MKITLKQAILNHPAGATVELDDTFAQHFISLGQAEAAPDSPVPDLLAKSMEGVLGQLNAAIEKSVDDALKKFAKELHKSRKNSVPAIIGDRIQTEIAFSEHAGFTTNQTFWRFIHRVGGMPWLRDKVTLSDASSTLSPFVALAAG